MLLFYRPICTTGTYLDAHFMETVSTIYMHAYGTEKLAPLLYSLVRFHRPSNIVEFGGGYTTPFLAKGLNDNAHDALNEYIDHPIPLMLHREWYEEGGSLKPRLLVIDDGSQDNKDFQSVMDELNFEKVHVSFKKAKHSTKPDIQNDSVGLIWNDAQW